MSTSKPYSLSTCKSELSVLLHNANYGGQNSILLVCLKDDAGEAHKLDLLLKDARKTYGTNANLYVLEFRAITKVVESAILNVPGRGLDFSFAFDLPALRNDLVSLLKALRIDEIEYLDHARSLDDIATLGTVLQCDRQRFRASALNQVQLLDDGASVSAYTPMELDCRPGGLQAQVAAIRAHSRVLEPIVSICLPVRNAQGTISETIRSILEQELDSIEVLVLDDCSTDKTFEILVNLARKDQRILPWRNNRSIGNLASFNECLARANGKFIKPLLQDSVLSKSSLSSMVACFEQNPDLVIVTSSIQPCANSVQSSVASSANSVAGSGRSLAGSGRSFAGSAISPPHTHARSPEPDGSVLPPVPFLRKNLSQCLSEGIFVLKQELGGAARIMFCADAIGKGFDSSLHHFAEIDYWLRILLKGDFGVLLDQEDSAIHAIAQCRSNSNSVTEWAVDNKTYIEMACELLDLQDRWLGYFSRFRLDRDVLIDQALLYLAGKFAINEDKYGRNGVTRLDSKTVDLAKLQLLTMSILATLGRCQYSPPEQEEKNQRYILLLEKQVRELLGTFSWKITKPMRDFKALISATEEAPLELPQECRLSQDEYAWYLRDLIRKVKTSRSWQITAPIRSFDGTRQQMLKLRSPKNV